MLPDTLTVLPVCVVALTLAPPKMLPPVMLPTALIVEPATILDETLSADTTLLDKLNPAAFKLPPVMLPVVLIRPDPATMLPPVIVPLALITPVIYAPVVAHTTTLLVPPTLTVTLPPELTTLTLLDPFCMLVASMPASWLPLPKM